MSGDRDNPYEPPSHESQQADAELPKKVEPPPDLSRRLMRLAIGGGGGLMLIPASIIAFCTTCVGVAVATGMEGVGLVAGMFAVVGVYLGYVAWKKRRPRR